VVLLGLGFSMISIGNTSHRQDAQGAQGVAQGHGDHGHDGRSRPRRAQHTSRYARQPHQQPPPRRGPGHQRWCTRSGKHGHRILREQGHTNDR
jgi:hypothetical protein